MRPRENRIDPPGAAFRKALSTCSDPALREADAFKQDFAYVLWVCIVDAYENQGPRPMDGKERAQRLAEILGDGSPPTIVRRKALESCYLMLGRRGFVEMMRRYGYKKIATFEDLHAS